MERILLCMENQEAGQRLQNWLAASYTVELQQAPAALEEFFDLVIVDAPSLRSLEDSLRARKDAAEPVILPVLLVATPRDGKLVVSQGLGLADEFIFAPVVRQELLVRVQNLLRTRRLSRERETGLVQAAELQSQAERSQAQTLELEVQKEELQRLGRELHQEREYLKAVLEQMPAGVIIAEAPPGGILSCNRRAAEIWRGGMGSITGLEDFCRYPRRHSDGRPYRPEEVPLWRSITLGEVVIGGEITIQREDGARRVLNVSAAPILDREGAIIAGVTTYDDITERIEAEEALRAANDKLLALVEASPLAIISIDNENRVLSWNPAAETIFGWRQEEVLGRTLPVVREEGMEEFLATRERDLEGEKVIGFETEVRKKDGSAIYISLSTAPVRNALGTVIATMGVAEDISGRRQIQENLIRAKEEWERTFDAVPDLIAILDRDHRVIRANRAMAAALGVEPRELLGRPCYEAVHNLSAPPDFCPHSPLTADGREHVTEVHKLGQDFLVTTTPLTDGQGNIFGSVQVARDITTRKKAEEAIKRQAELLDLAHDAIIVRDLKDRIVFWNRGAEEIYGWSPEEALGRHHHALLQTEFPKPLEEIEKELLQAGRWEGELTQTSRDGRRLVVASRWALHRGGLEDSARILVINNDITESKRAEELLKMQALVLESMGEGVCVSDEHGVMFFANPAFDAMFGYERGELIGQHVTVLNYASPEENARLATQVMGQLLTTGVWSGEFRNRKKDGSLFYTSCLINTLGLSGRKNFISVQSDITARKEAEEALRKAHDELELRVGQRTAELQETLDKLVEEVQERLRVEKALRESEERFASFMRYLPGAAIMRDTQGRYVFANETWEKVFDKKPEEVLGKTLEEVWPAQFATYSRGLDEMVLKSKQALEKIEGFPGPGGMRYFLACRFPILDQSGRPVMLGGIGIDVTERQRAEEALKESEQKLRFLTSQILTVQEKERSLLSRELHDGLGQALLVFKLQMRAIERKLPPETGELKDDCRHALRYIDEIIEDIRRLSRDLSPSVLEDIGLAAALKNLCEDFSRLHDLEVYLEMADVEVELSKEAQINIYRIFQEALANISKYAFATRVELAIKKQNHQIAFSIRDDGVGFNVEEILAERGPNQGWGLTAMDERARMLGGALSVSSQEGAGTTIAFTIPREI